MKTMKTMKIMKNRKINFFLFEKSPTPQGKKSPPKKAHPVNIRQYAKTGEGVASKPVLTGVKTGQRGVGSLKKIKIPVLKTGKTGKFFIGKLISKQESPFQKSK